MVLPLVSYRGGDGRRGAGGRIQVMIRGLLFLGVIPKV